MTQAARVRSLDAIVRFRAAVASFQQEARLCLATIETQLRTILFWLERDRPHFWKREIENCFREVADARVRLHQCRMRRIGDFRPSCIEEQKDLEKARKDTEFAQKQIPVIKRWQGEAAHEANEYHGRAAQLVQTIERDLPRLLALLSFTIDRLEAYASVGTPGAAPPPAFFSQLAGDLDQMLAALPDASVPDVALRDAVAAELPLTSEAAPPDAPAAEL
jgi:hypothetical protein